MEVHPPHAPLHSWKDFWIHLGTITIGLLIAISLEQSVEKLHHLHQRHELEEQLRAEGERNIEIVKADQRYFADMRLWQLDLRKRVDAMRASGGKAGLAYLPDTSLGQPTVPSNSVWLTAKESALVVLLTQNEAAMYSRMDVQHKMLEDTIDHWFATRDEVAAFEEDFDDAGPTSVPDLSRMSPDELHTYSMLLTRDVVARDEVMLRLANFLAFDQAILGGAKTEDEMFRAVRHGAP
jgi:hypothetical protein